MKKLILLVTCLFSGVAIKAMECSSGRCGKAKTSTNATPVNPVGQAIRNKYCGEQNAAVPVQQVPAQPGSQKVSAISAAIKAKYCQK